MVLDHFTKRKIRGGGTLPKIFLLSPSSVSIKFNHNFIVAVTTSGRALRGLEAANTVVY